MTRDWNQASLTELAAHIVATHHAFCREQMPRLAAQFAAAAAEGGHRYPSLASLKASFQRISAALTTHLLKEESVLFPLIERIDAAHRNGTPPPVSSFGSVDTPIRMMMLEHSEAEVLLQQMRVASNGFQAPESAGTQLQELCRALRAFDADMTRHVELEDKFLFPRVVVAENEAGR